jgi:hypothetical protein
MLSFSITNSGRTIQIDCDDAGISKLIDVLSKLPDSGTHIHLWGPPIANDLSTRTPFGNDAVQEVIITHGGD